MPDEAGEAGAGLWRMPRPALLPVILGQPDALAGSGAPDDMAAWVWDTAPMRYALARLDFPAVLVIYRCAARLSRRELGDRAGVSESVIWYWEAGKRQGIYDIRQLLQFADAVRMPRPALLPVILGQPRALSDLLADPATLRINGLPPAAAVSRHGEDDLR